MLSRLVVLALTSIAWGLLNPALRLGERLCRHAESSDQ